MIDRTKFEEKEYWQPRLTPTRHERFRNKAKWSESFAAGLKARRANAAELGSPPLSSGLSMAESNGAEDLEFESLEAVGNVKARVARVLVLDFREPSSEHLTLSECGGWCISAHRRIINPTSDIEPGLGWVDASEYL